MKKNTILKLVACVMLLVLVGSFAPAIIHMLENVSAAGVAGSLAAAPLVTMFTKEIEEQLYPENEFYLNATDDSMWIKGDKVSRGVAGAAPTAQTNPALPLVGTQRTDDSNEYSIALHVTDPTILTRDEELIVNYNKRQSILSGHANTLNTRVADHFSYIWAPSAAGFMLRTTGAAVAVADAGQTGTRNEVTKNDFIDASTMLDRQDTQGNRFGLIPATMYGQLLKIADFVDYTKTGRADMLAKGIIGEILGIKIYKRSRTTRYSNAGTPVRKAVGAANAATDNLSILIWAEGSVYKALGKPNVNIENRPATYLGDLLNTDVRAGGKTRSDGAGAVSIIQTLIS